jgi:hypothetical protein
MPHIVTLCVRRTQQPTIMDVDFCPRAHTRTEATPGLNDLATNNPDFPSVE